MRNIARKINIQVYGLMDLPLPPEKAQGELRLASPTDQPDEPALDEPALDEVEEARDAEPAAAFIEKNEDTP